MSGPTLTLHRRIAALEATVRRLRLAAAVFALIALLFSAAAWRSRAGTVEASAVVLTDTAGTPVLVLRGVRDTEGPGLVLARPSGPVVMRLGGASARPVR